MNLCCTLNASYLHYDVQLSNKDLCLIRKGGGMRLIDQLRKKVLKYSAQQNKG